MGKDQVVVEIAMRMNCNVNIHMGDDNTYIILLGRVRTGTGE